MLLFTTLKESTFLVSKLIILRSVSRCQIGNVPYACWVYSSRLPLDDTRGWHTDVEASVRVSALVPIVSMVASKGMRQSTYCNPLTAVPRSAESRRNNELRAVQ